MSKKKKPTPKPKEPLNEVTEPTPPVEPVADEATPEEGPGPEAPGDEAVGREVKFGSREWLPKVGDLFTGASTRRPGPFRIEEVYSKRGHGWVVLVTPRPDGSYRLRQRMSVRDLCRQYRPLEANAEEASTPQGE